MISKTFIVYCFINSVIEDYEPFSITAMELAKLIVSLSE